MFPWDGKLGRVAKRCIYCGNSGPSFYSSSAMDHCFEPKCPSQTGGEPIKILASQLRVMERKAAQQWCKKNKMDYDKIKKEMDEKKK